MFPARRAMEKTYETYREGPFWRVQAARPAGAGGQGAGESGAQARPGAAPAGGPARGVPAQPPTDPLEVAQAYSREHLGREYTPVPNLPSSLRKQHPIGLAYELAASRHPEYERRVFEQYRQQHPEMVGRAKDYDELRRRAYGELMRETRQQFDAMPLRMSYHQHGEGNYPNSKAMAEDVRNNGHLYVFQGGEPHEFLHEVDPRTGLSANDMFRAVHDYFGHAVHGTSFGPHGEEQAWAAHSGLFSPLAQAALSSETRGQNSFVNYTPINALLKSRVAKLSEAIAQANRYGDKTEAAKLMALRQELMGEFQYAKQAAVLLPPEMLRGDYKGAVPEYLRDLIQPSKEHASEADLVHYSRHPSLTRTDPRFYGTGIKGQDVGRAKGNAPDRTYFYVGEPRVPEAGLGPHKYKTRLGGLYDLAEDPLHLHQLAQESNRTPHTAAYNQGVIDQEAAANDLERLVHERGFNGILNPKRNVAAVFHPVEVQRYAKGGRIDLRRHGKTVESVDEALVHHANGRRVFGFHEMGDDPVELKTPNEINNFAPDQLLVHIPKYASGGVVSAVDKALPTLKRKKGTYDEYMAELRSKPGIKPAELEARAVLLEHKARLDAEGPMDPGKFRAQFTGVGSAPHPKIIDLRPGEEIPGTGGQLHDDVYEKYTIPGGHNYREMLFQHPATPGGKEFRSQHYPDLPNIMAHARLKDRMGANGEKVLHVEEIQSDWHQKGRKDGYSTPLDDAMLQQAAREKSQADFSLWHAKERYEAAKRDTWLSSRDAELNHWGNRVAELTGRALKAREEHEKLHNRLTKQVPDAPFKKDWHEMVLKHLIAHAVKNGYDALAVTPGEEQAKRYDLSKHIDQLTSYRRPGGKYMLSMQAKGKQFPEPPHEVEESDLERAVGKDLAAKIREHKDDIVPWRGLDLQVGGEGMKGFYDKMVPAFLNKIGKPFGAQVRPLTVSEMKPSVTMSEVMDALAAAGHSQHEINNNPELYRQMGERMRAERDEQPNDEYTLHGFPITPEMRQHVENEGLPLFAKGGDVHDTPEFKRWFRRSVLRDDEGKPMVLYHATPRDFKEFKPGGPDPDISGRAIWLSASKEHQPAAHHTRMVPGQPGRVYRHTVDKFTPGTNVMPLYARMENPLWVDEDMKNEIRQRHGLSRAFPTLVTDKDLEILRRGGYDSVIHTGLDKNLGGNEYVALDPHQIKSAIGNRGTFDPNDPDITKASGGAVEPEPTMGALAALRRRS
jgi:hypothetical protein